MKKTNQMYEGKAKKVFETDNPDYVIVDYKDDATAFNGLKKGTIVGKGVVNNKVSNHRQESADRSAGSDRQKYCCRQPFQAPWAPGGNQDEVDCPGVLL